MPQGTAVKPVSAKVKRLILCFDGTWNTPEDHTNVARIYAAVADKHSGCESQLKFYDEGVGTTAGSRIRGGAMGLGLDQNILQGYAWLINEYFEIEPAREEGGESFAAGPDIFIFGFSRGAFTARSLAGLINRCGIPKAQRVAEDDPNHNGRANMDSSLVKDAWKLYQTEFPGVEARVQPECREFRDQNSWNVKIKFIGVWDTVGALGVPMFSNSLFARARHGFHDASLGRVVENAYHAVAIDEQREDYKVTLWDKKYETQNVEQRWFPGAHANVGGGYEDDLLPDPPLKWIAECAIGVGLEFTDQFGLRLAAAPACKSALPEDFKLRGDEYLSPVRDSYADFLFGIYRVFRSLTWGRYWRRMLVDGVNESIDQTAHMKWAADPYYRPRNLASAGRDDFVSKERETRVEVPAAPAGAGNA